MVDTVELREGLHLLFRVLGIEAVYRPVGELRIGYLFTVVHHPDLIVDSGADRVLYFVEDDVQENWVATLEQVNTIVRVNDADSCHLGFKFSVELTNRFKEV